MSRFWQWFVNQKIHHYWNFPLTDFVGLVLHVGIGISTFMTCFDFITWFAMISFNHTFQQHKHPTILSNHTSGFHVNNIQLLVIAIPLMEWLLQIETMLSFFQIHRFHHHWCIFYLPQELSGKGHSLSIIGCNSLEIKTGMVFFVRITIN